MRIRMLTCYAGVDFTVNANEETERFSDSEAIRMIENGTAVPAAPPVERAVKTVQETRGPVENNAGGRSGGTKRKRK
jgi:hypothetical protein